MRGREGRRKEGKKGGSKRKNNRVRVRKEMEEVKKNA